MAASDKYTGAMDIGGTKTLAALFSPEGRLLDGITEIPTPVELEPGDFTRALAELFLSAVDTNGCRLEQVRGLGLGVPSTVDYSAGLLDGSPNLPRITDYPLAGELSEKLGIPATMENDANCFALGEAAYGAAAGCGSCCGITLGTGLGLGVVLGGRLLRGAHGCAGEIWHAPYLDGIMEDRVSGRALEKQYEQSGGGRATGAEIHARAQKGEELAQRVLAGMGEALGHSLACLVNVFDPEAVVIGGSVAKAWEFFEGPMNCTLDRYRIGRNRTMVLPGKLGNRAVLFGALALAGQWE